MPRISPGRTSKLTPSSTRRQPRLLTLSSVRLRTERTGAPELATESRRVSVTSRPTIAEMIALSDRPSIGAVNTRSPSRSTVTAIGESDDFVQAVRRVDDRNARLRELPHDLEQGLAFRGRERGRRLVHDQNPRVQRQRLGDFDQLLFADPELGDATLRVNLDAEPLQERARGLDDAPVVDEGAEDQRLAAKEDVLGRGQFGNQVQFLVDDRDAGALGVLNAREANRRALDPDLAVIVDVHAGEDLHQGRFARAVLTHEGVDFAAPQVEVDVAQSCYAGEGFGDAFGFKDDGVIA